MLLIVGDKCKTIFDIGLEGRNSFLATDDEFCVKWHWKKGLHKSMPVYVIFSIEWHSNIKPPHSALINAENSAPWQSIFPDQLYCSQKEHYMDGENLLFFHECLRSSKFSMKFIF